MRTNWMQGRLSEAGRVYGSLRHAKSTGWKGSYGPRRFTGYHKCLPLAELKALAAKLQHQASR
jgi:hypothetical protein